MAIVPTVPIVMYTTTEVALFYMRHIVGSAPRPIRCRTAKCLRGAVSSMPPTVLCSMPRRNVSASTTRVLKNIIFFLTSCILVLAIQNVYILVGTIPYDSCASMHPTAVCFMSIAMTGGLDTATVFFIMTLWAALSPAEPIIMNRGTHSTITMMPTGSSSRRQERCTIWAWRPT